MIDDPVHHLELEVSLRRPKRCYLEQLLTREA